MISSSSKRTKVFISYSHKDARYLDQLVEHLAYYERNNLIDFWSDKKITPGTQWRDEIKQAIESTKVAVLLISPSFSASKFIAENELPPLLDAAKKEGAIILPVIVRPSNFEDTQLVKFQAVNSPSMPIAKMKGYQRDDLWAKVVRDINKAIGPQQLQSSTSGSQQSTIVQSIQTGNGRSLFDIEQRGNFTEDDFRNVERHSLFKAIHEAFNFFELEMLCMQLGTRYQFIVDFQELSFSDAIFKVIEYCQQPDQYALLVRKVLEAQPHLAEKLIKQR